MSSGLQKFNIGGSNYSQLPIQPWDVMSQKGTLIPFLEGCIIKRLMRQTSATKRVEDLKKARHEIDRLIQEIEKCPSQ